MDKTCEEYENLYGEYNWLARAIIDRIKKVLSIRQIPWEVSQYIQKHPCSIAKDPHLLDKFGYRFDGDDNWWI